MWFLSKCKKFFYLLSNYGIQSSIKQGKALILFLFTYFSLTLDIYFVYSSIFIKFTVYKLEVVVYC